MEETLNKDSLDFIFTATDIKETVNNCDKCVLDDKIFISVCVCVCVQNKEASWKLTANRHFFQLWIQITPKTD